MTEFARPWMLPLAVVAPLLLAWLTVVRHRNQRVPSLAVARGPLRAVQPAPILALAGVAAAWLAAAGPERVFVRDAPATGRDVVVLLDLSASMGGRGPAGDALAGARRAIQQLAASRRDDRLALVAFGTRAAVLSPLTRDHATLVALASRMTPGSLGARTALGDGLAVALRLVDRSAPGRAGIVLVTDGESNAGALDPVTAADVAAERGVSVDAVAVASGAGEGEAGRVNEPLLRAIAARTGGHFVRARDEGALQQAFSDLARLQPTVRRQAPRTSRDDRSGVPARWAAVLLLAAAVLEPVGRRAWA